MSPCFDVPFPLDALETPRPISAAHRRRVEPSACSRQALNRLSIDTPHRPRSAGRRCVQSLMLPSSKLRITLLHCAPTSPLAVSHSTFISSHIRTMSTKPSLKAAEDFLSFVNASPTRMSHAVVILVHTDTQQHSTLSSQQKRG